MQEIKENQTLEDIKHIDEHGIEFWYARELQKVLAKFIDGQSYLQIAESLNSPVKSIDNAIQRIRKKAIKNLEND